MMAHEICTADILPHVINPPEPYTERMQCICMKFKGQKQPFLYLQLGMLELVPRAEIC